MNKGKLFMVMGYNASCCWQIIKQEKCSKVEELPRHHFTSVNVRQFQLNLLLYPASQLGAASNFRFQMRYLTFLMLTLLEDKNVQIKSELIHLSSQLFVVKFQQKPVQDKIWRYLTNVLFHKLKRPCLIKRWQERKPLTQNRRSSFVWTI